MAIIAMVANVPIQVGDEGWVEPTYNQPVVHWS